MKKQGMLMIISGPSGTGKGTVVKELVEKQQQFALSVSATTRSPRHNEVFEKMKNENQLLEWAEFCGNYYGTPKEYVEQQMAEGKNVILEIEVQGALQIKKIYKDCILVFMIPPSAKELKKRLTERATEDEQTIQRRINRAIEEMEFVPQYDYIVINDTVCCAVNAICDIVKVEGMKSSRNINIKKQFKGEITSC